MTQKITTWDGTVNNGYNDRKQIDYIIINKIGSWDQEHCYENTIIEHCYENTVIEHCYETLLWT